MYIDLVIKDGAVMARGTGNHVGHLGTRSLQPFEQVRRHTGAETVRFVPTSHE